MEPFAEYEHLAIEEVCRICLTKKDQMTLICEAGLADMLLECASINVTAEDGLFHLVCDQCSNEVSRWYVFKQQVVRSFEIGHWLIEKKSKTLNNTCTTLKCELVNSFKTDESTNSSNTSHSSSITDDVEKLESLLKQHNPHIMIMQTGNPSSDMFSIVDTINSVALNQNNSEHETSLTTTSGSKRRKLLEELLCNVCGKQCTSTNGYNRHMKTHDDTRPYICCKCDKPFKTSQVHTIREKKFECDVCHKFLLTAGSLVTHKRKHSGIKPFQCLGCEKNFFTKEAMQRHFGAIHDTDNNFLCSICTKLCSTKVHLNNHMKKKHLGLGQPANAVCNECGKRCGSAAELKVHIRVHTGERPYVCDICDKRFIAKGNLNSHKQRHSGKKPFLCNHCGKVFGEKSTLKVHERIHTGEHPYTCDICGKAYIQSSALRTHMKNHWK